MSFFTWKLRHIHTGTHYIIGRNGQIHCGHCGATYTPSTTPQKEKK